MAKKKARKGAKPSVRGNPRIGGNIPLIERLKPEQWTRIVQMSMSCLPVKSIAQVCQISIPTVMKWFDLGEKVLNQYESFDDVPKSPAESYLMAKLVSECNKMREFTGFQMHKHAIERAKVSDQVLMRFLGSKYREHWSETPVVEAPSMEAARNTEVHVHLASPVAGLPPVGVHVSGG